MKRLLITALSLSLLASTVQAGKIGTKKIENVSCVLKTIGNDSPAALKVTCDGKDYVVPPGHEVDLHIPVPVSSPEALKENSLANAIAFTLHANSESKDVINGSVTCSCEEKPWGIRGLYWTGLFHTPSLAVTLRNSATGDDISERQAHQMSNLAEAALVQLFINLTGRQGLRIGSGLTHKRVLPHRHAHKAEVRKMCRRKGHWEALGFQKFSLIGIGSVRRLTPSA